MKLVSTLTMTMHCNADYAEHALASPASAGNLKLNPNEAAPSYGCLLKVLLTQLMHAQLMTK